MSNNDLETIKKNVPDAWIPSLDSFIVKGSNAEIWDKDNNRYLDYVGGYDCVDPPIVISPNADGTNDTWRPAIDLDVDIYVTIYNRWGQIEFFKKANSAIFEWDGSTTDGRFLPTADYYFVIDFIDQDTMSDKTGVITLIR